MMTNVDADVTPTSSGPEHNSPDEQGDSVAVLGIAPVALSWLGFLTLLKLADRRDRSPARALGLSFATSLETIGGTVLGFTAVRRASGSRHSGKGLMLGAAGAVLEVISTILNFNWMRTMRRL